MFNTPMLKKTRKTTGVNVKASAPNTSLVLIREPSRLRRWSTYSLTKFLTSMKPSVTVKIKMSVETAQTVYVCSGLDGPNSPKLNELCHTTSATNTASSRVALMYISRLRKKFLWTDYSDQGRGWD